MNELFDKQTYETFLGRSDVSKVDVKMMEQKNSIIDVKVKPEDIKMPEKWPELERFMQDRDEIRLQRQTATKAVQLPLVHPVMRATLLALEGAGIIKDEHQAKLLETVGEMVDGEIEVEFAKLEKKMRDDKFKLLYGEETRRRVYIEKCHKTYCELSPKKYDGELTGEEELNLLEAMCAILMDGNIDPLNDIYYELHPIEKSQ